MLNQSYFLIITYKIRDNKLYIMHVVDNSYYLIYNIYKDICKIFYVHYLSNWRNIYANKKD